MATGSLAKMDLPHQLRERERTVQLRQEHGKRVPSAAHGARWSVVQQEQEGSMITYTVEVYESGAWAALKSWVLPFTDGECLDAGSATLSMSERRDALRPFTRIRISVYEGDSASGTPVEVIERVGMSDVVKLRRFRTE